MRLLVTGLLSIPLAIINVWTFTHFFGEVHHWSVFFGIGALTYLTTEPIVRKFIK